MIKRNELRIGNYVSAFGRFSKIEDEIDLDFCSNSADVSAISLTLEILNNCFLEDSIVCRFKWIGNENDENIEVIYENDIFITNPKYSVAISHVHQLQNLYYRITGYELEINFNYKKGNIILAK